MTRPLSYYVVAVYLACFSLIIFQSSKFVGIVVLLLFLIIIFFTMDLKEFILVVSFFLIGCLSFYTYFNISIDNNTNCVRIIQNKRRSCIANYKGRKIILKGKFKNIKDGSRLNIIGNYTSKIDYERGIIGEYTVKEFKKTRVDWIEKLYVFREKLYKKYTSLLDKKKAAVIMACCYGDTKYLTIDTKNQINRLGISHIISVSGLHIALVYRIMEKIFGIKLALCMAFIYMIFTGAKASIVRAYIMIVILKMAKIVYKNYDSLSSLSLAAIILILIKPYYVMDLGFNLSFLATLGIIMYNKKIQRALYKLPIKINEGLSMTFSAQIFSMPYAMGTLNNISIFFVLGNLILVPIYSIVILIGNFSIIFFKSDVIFSGISKIIYLLLTIIDGGMYLLLKITPDVVQYNYFYGMCIVSIFITYVLLKYGYKKVIYFPILVMCFAIVYNIG